MAYGASLAGVGEAADARDALAGARAKEDELGLQALVLLRRRGARIRAAPGRRTGDAAAEGARWKRNTNKREALRRAADTRPCGP